MKDINQQNHVNRRYFLKSAAFLLGSLGLSQFDAFAVPLEQAQIEEGLFACNPLIWRKGDSELEILCVFKKPVVCWLHYSKQPENLNQKTREVRDGMAHVGTIHRIPVANLDPNIPHHYQIEASEVIQLERKDSQFGPKEKSPVFSLKGSQSNQAETSFIVFNDIHETPTSFAELRKLSTINEPEFYVLNGDMVSSMKSEDHFITNVLAPMALLTESSIPVIYSRGNHETWSGHARQITDYMRGVDHPFYYGFRQGPVYMLIMDSGETRSDEDAANWGLIEFDAYRSKQADWLKEELAKPACRDAKYRIVVTHIPPFYAGKELHAATQYFKEWGDLLNAANISLMLCGHTHKPGIHPSVPGKHNFPIVIGGGPKPGNRTVIQVQANSAKLNLSLIRDDGTSLGNLTV